MRGVDPSTPRFAIAVVVAVLSGTGLHPGGAARAQVLPVGTEFLVNTYTPRSQSEAAVAIDAAGDFVVAWKSYTQVTPYGDYGIRARRFAAGGTPLGDDFQVDTYTSGETKSLPAVAADAAGGFVVVWQSMGSSGNDSSLWSIQGRRYDSSGLPTGPEFQVNTLTTDVQVNAQVAPDAQGGFVVVWESATSSGSDQSWHSIQARRFDADGVPLGPEAQVNSYTTSRQGRPAVAVAPSGGFVVAWESDGSSGSDTSSYSIQAQRFSVDGLPIGAQFQVNTYTTGFQIWPSIAVGTQGDFLVTWSSDGSPGSDSDVWSVQGRLFDADGIALGDQFQVNSVTTGYQYTARAAADAQGGFVVVWMSDSSAGSDQYGSSIQAQRYRVDGVALGWQFQVNSYTPSWQLGPALAADPQGHLVVAWTSELAPGGWPWDVEGQRYLIPFFYDGFESGDTTSWSATIP